MSYMQNVMGTEEYIEVAMDSINKCCNPREVLFSMDLNNWEVARYQGKVRDWITEDQLRSVVKRGLVTPFYGDTSVCADYLQFICNSFSVEYGSFTPKEDYDLIDWIIAVAKQDNNLENDNYVGRTVSYVLLWWFFISIDIHCNNYRRLFWTEIELPTHEQIREYVAGKITVMHVTPVILQEKLNYNKVTRTVQFVDDKLNRSNTTLTKQDALFYLFSQSFKPNKYTISTMVSAVYYVLYDEWLRAKRITSLEGSDEYITVVLCSASLAPNKYLVFRYVLQWVSICNGYGLNLSDENLQLLCDNKTNSKHFEEVLAALKVGQETETETVQQLWERYKDKFSIEKDADYELLRLLQLNGEDTSLKTTLKSLLTQ